MNTKQKIAVIVVLVALVAGLVIYEKSKSKPDQTEIALKTGFMQECTVSGQYAYCECTYNDLRKKLGVDGFISESLKYMDNGILPKSVIDSALKCMTEYNY